MQLPNEAVFFEKTILSAAEQAAESEDLMEFFNSAVDTLQTIVVGLGGALCVWGGINLLEGYGQDNPGSKSQGVKQLVAGGGVALIGVTLVPLLSGLLAKSCIAAHNFPNNEHLKSYSALSRSHGEGAERRYLCLISEIIEKWIKAF